MTCQRSTMMHEGARVLVTRTWPGCDETARRLVREGFEPVVSPCLDIVSRQASLPELDNVAGLVFTSANGVRAFCERSQQRDLVAWCVGPATAAEAQREGFGDVRNANGDAGELTAFIASRARPADGRLIHVANDAAAGELVKSLRTRGFDVEFAALYTTRPAKALLPGAVQALQDGTLSAVLLHSAKGAAGLASLLSDGNISQITAVAISERAAAPIVALPWHQVSIAEAPNEDALIKALRMCQSPD